jgi:Grx4 family monothiol glutaredoxin
MSVTKLTPSTSKEFLEANKDALIVLVFDAEFTEQKELVDAAVKALVNDAEISSKIALAQVDVEQNNDLATEFTITSVPMIACVKKGQTIKRIDTLDPTNLTNMVREQLRLLEMVSTNESGESVDPKETFKAYLKKLTTRAPVMIFMKGHPEAPRCGFSKQLVELLAKHNIKYESFDILQDEDVRQGLKEYSEWPTYPQIYVKGEFIGGLDILKQLDESGEIESTFKV